jgi:hypothetical protein
MRRARHVALLLLAAAAVVPLAAGCSSDSDSGSSGSGGGDEVTIVTTLAACDEVIAEVRDRLAGFDTTVDAADLQSIEAEVNAGTGALDAAGCEDSLYGELSEARCDSLLTLEGADAQADAVLAGFQDACSDE